jgi:hypothetical protein
MLVIVAVNAEQFPVAAVGRVVVVIVVPMVHRQFAKLLAFEFPDTSGADMGEEFQGPFPVSGLSQLFRLAHLCDDLLILLVVRCRHDDPLEIFIREQPVTSLL